MPGCFDGRPLCAAAGLRPAHAAAAMDIGWCLDVEPAMDGRRKTPKRDQVVDFLALVLLLRRYATCRRAASRANNARAAAYRRWPAGPARLMRRKHKIAYIAFRRGVRVRHTRTIAASGVLHAAKLNHEPSDPCTLLSTSILAQCTNRSDLMYKAYVLVRTYSQRCLRLRAWRRPWSSVKAGVELLLAEVDTAQTLFTRSFGPNKRCFAECSAARSGRQYVRKLFAGTESVQPLTWRLRDGRGWRYSSRENLFLELL